MVALMKHQATAKEIYTELLFLLIERIDEQPVGNAEKSLLHTSITSMLFLDALTLLAQQNPALASKAIEQLQAELQQRLQKKEAES